jgi:hypothetical protein
MCGVFLFDSKVRLAGTLFKWCQRVVLDDMLQIIVIFFRTMSS